MKKKIISLLLIAIISSTALISCGKTKAPSDSDKQPSVTEEQSPKDTSKDSKIVGENNKPTVEIKQIATIADFKDKSKADIEKILGKPVSEDDSKSTYEKDNYTFEVTYLNSKCNEIKITPKTDMKFPADGANILNLLGINAGDPDTLSPAGMEWDNKFDTYKINVVSDNQVQGKISYADIILNNTSK
ncbi:hypothetical protein [Clostridium sp. BL-8]|uniref:hypothetical protein n=1 Tax=Clostridium sp. BL-8 TaxID=349938 RepID=UPI00098C2F51|nr:hypothetical protein [Clostridium sp. BL-8]OOM78474.1 hypothetical protein CLOBL_23220 [Clostridium sp. BL-8]